MDLKPDPGHEFRAIYHVRGGNHSTYTLILPSKFKKTIVLITPLMKYGGAVALSILARTTPDVRVVVITQRSIDVESLRAQLPFSLRRRFLHRECELQSQLSIRMAMLWIRMMLDNVHIVVHLEPQLGDSSTNIRDGTKALLCANSFSIESFRKDFLKYFGANIRYVQFNFSITENSAAIAEKVINNYIN